MTSATIETEQSITFEVALTPLTNGARQARLPRELVQHLELAKQVITEKNGIKHRLKAGFSTDSCKNCKNKLTAHLKSGIEKIIFCYYCGEPVNLNDSALQK